MASKTKQRLSWSKRARRDQTLTAKRRTWRSACGRYLVQESNSLFGLPTVYYAIDVFGPTLLGRHRRRSGAEKRCQHHLNRGRK